MTYGHVPAIQEIVKFCGDANHRQAQWNTGLFVWPGQGGADLALLATCADVQSGPSVVRKPGGL